MSYFLELSPKAKKSLDKVPRAEFLRLDPAIRQLMDNPRPNGVKKLKDNIHRIRTGPWRVIYHIIDAEKLISIIEVVRRSKSTYNEYRG